MLAGPGIRSLTEPVLICVKAGLLSGRNTFVYGQHKSHKLISRTTGTDKGVPALAELLARDMRGHLKHGAVVLVLFVPVDKGDIIQHQHCVFAGFLDRIGRYAEFNQSFVELISS